MILGIASAVAFFYLGAVCSTRGAANCVFKASLLALGVLHVLRLVGKV